tara:strand:+ start:439 stop:624 length:186 start_codon:yes stop_codon:yes gene_type:complete
VDTIYEKSLAAMDELFKNTTPEEFEREYLAIEKKYAGVDTVKVSDYIKALDERLSRITRWR